MRLNAVPEHVDYEEAKCRILEWWNKSDRQPIPLNWFAHAVWPGHKMKAHGAALAVSPIIRKMRKEGLVDRDLYFRGVAYRVWA